MPSFDIVSELDEVELQNTVDNTIREISSRFDLRGVETEITLKDLQVSLKAEADFQCKQILDIFRLQMSKRNLDPKSMEVADSIVHSGKTFTQNLSFKQGIDAVNAKKIVKFLKDSKLKVQASIQGESVRVTGKKRDDLQEAIAVLRGTEIIEIPLQFNNFRD